MIKVLAAPLHYYDFYEAVDPRSIQDDFEYIRTGIRTKRSLDHQRHSTELNGGMHLLNCLNEEVKGLNRDEIIELIKEWSSQYQAYIWCDKRVKKYARSYKWNWKERLQEIEHDD